MTVKGPPIFLKARECKVKIKRSPDIPLYPFRIGYWLIEHKNKNFYKCISNSASRKFAHGRRKQISLGEWGTHLTTWNCCNCSKLNQPQCCLFLLSPCPKEKGGRLCREIVTSWSAVGYREPGMMETIITCKSGIVQLSSFSCSVYNCARTGCCARDLFLSGKLIACPIAHGILMLRYLRPLPASIWPLWTRKKMEAPLPAWADGYKLIWRIRTLQKLRGEESARARESAHWFLPFLRSLWGS